MTPLKTYDIIKIEKKEGLKLKEKKVVARDVVYDRLAELLLKSGEKAITRYKEGLRLEVGDETCIVRVIQKKAAPTADLEVGLYELFEDGGLSYVDYRAKEEDSEVE